MTLGYMQVLMSILWLQQNCLALSFEWCILYCFESDHSKHLFSMNLISWYY